jgi:hypothetical protein
MGKKTTIAIISGFFDPVRKEDLKLFDDVKQIADKLIIIVKNDNQYKQKTKILEDEAERCLLVSNVKTVDGVMLSLDHDESVNETLQVLYERYSKLADPADPNNPREFQLMYINANHPTACEILERDVCLKYKIFIIDGFSN